MTETILTNLESFWNKLLSFGWMGYVVIAVMIFVLITFLFWLLKQWWKLAG